MHELSIAHNIVDIVHQYVEEERLPLVQHVSVQIGVLSGVVSDSLEFNFEALVADTSLGNARLRIVHVPFVIQCHACGTASELETGIAVCPHCGSVKTQTLSGSELQVMEIVVNEPEVAA